MEAEDNVTAYLEFPDGATGVFITSTGDAPGANRLELVLTKGTVKCENEKLSLYLLEEDGRKYCFTADNPYGAPAWHFADISTDGRNEQHQGVINAFIANILGKGELAARCEEGLKSLVLTNAMYFSSWTGRPVDIPFDEDIYLALLNRKIKESKGERHV